MNLKEYKKQYYKENIEKIKAYKKKYYQDNKEEITAKTKLWRENNKEKVKANLQKKRPIKICVQCGKEITEKNRRKYCSNYCYLKYNNLKKKLKNPEKYKKKCRRDYLRLKERGYYKEREKKLDVLCEEWGISKMQLETYGKLFLEENPEVVEVLRVINKNMDYVVDVSKQETIDKGKITKQKWYEKNKEKVEAQKKKWRDNNKDKIKSYASKFDRGKYYQENKEDILEKARKNYKLRKQNKK